MKHNAGLDRRMLAQFFRAPMTRFRGSRSRPSKWWRGAARTGANSGRTKSSHFMPGDADELRLRTKESRH